MTRLSRAQLAERLDQRNSHPEQAEAIDAALWQECGADRALLVLDLSGFTRLTRKLGILHFLSVYRRASRLVLPIIEVHGGRMVKSEADNVIGSFRTASDALRAAVDMQQRSEQLNQQLADDHQVRLCIALGAGRILELADDVFGDEVNVTFKLGEDVARAGEILLTDSAWRALGEGATAVSAESRDIELGGVQIRYWSMR